MTLFQVNTMNKHYKRHTKPCTLVIWMFKMFNDVQKHTFRRARAMYRLCMYLTLENGGMVHASLFKLANLVID